MRMSQLTSHFMHRRSWQNRIRTVNLRPARSMSARVSSAEVPRHSCHGKESCTRSELELLVMDDVQMVWSSPKRRNRLADLIFRPLVRAPGPVSCEAAETFVGEA